MTLSHLQRHVHTPYLSEPQRRPPQRTSEPDPSWTDASSEPPQDPAQADPLEKARRTAGDRVVDVASRLLGQPTDLTQAPGAQSALLMAVDVAAQALAGVDFLTRLEFSAVHPGARFKACAQELNIPVDGLSQDQRERIDSLMQERFAEAAASGNSPVDPHLAKQWLHHALFRLTC